MFPIYRPPLTPGGESVKFYLCIARPGVWNRGISGDCEYFGVSMFGNRSQENRETAMLSKCGLKLKIASRWLLGHILVSSKAISSL